MSDAGQPEIAAEATRWEVPAIDGSDGRGFLTAGRLEELQQQAYDEAYQAGMQAGTRAGEDQKKRRALRFDELLNALARPFDTLDETVEKQLVELSITLVKQLFRREMQIDPGHVIGVAREAIQLLPVASRDITIHLHPEDAAMVLESLAPVDGERAWAVTEDPLITRGGCTVTSENSRIDAQAETRLKAVISRIAGDGREK